MSWIQWHDEVWPVTDDQAELRVYLWPPDCGYPRPSWHFELMHLFRPPDADATKDYSRDRWIGLELEELFFHEPDWRRLSRHEIRATPAWHDAHEHFMQHHRLVESRITLGCKQVRRTADEPRKTAGQEYWRAHDFIIRFGERDGLCFPCEIDAWMIHEDDYNRTEPEDPATIAPFAATPPNLRVITRALLVGISAAVPRAGHRDPAAAARRLIEEGIGYDGELRDPEIEWDLRRDLETNDYVENPGWSSTVRFSTGVSIYKDPI
ncbi:MAG TPA: hypothetical protein VGL24_08780 [Chthoniobacterales bacterium]